MRRALVVLVMLVSSRAGADDATTAAAIGDDVRSEAQGHSDRGRQYYLDGDFVAAAVEFSQAEKQFATVALGPDGKVVDADAHARRRGALSNAATAYSNAAMPVEALEMFTRLRGAYDAELSKLEREEIDDAIVALRERVGTVNVSGLPAKADVRIDGRLAPPEAGVRAFPLAAGQHALEVTAKGYDVFLTSFTVAAATRIEVAVVMVGSRAPARVRIESVIEPATVFVDGKEIGPAPVELDATAGAHTYRVEAESYREQTGGFTAVAGERTLIRVALAPRRSPIGMGLEGYFAGNVMNRSDTPLGQFDIGFGLRMFHDKLSFAGIQFGMGFEGHSREMNKYGIGPFAFWCPDKFSWGSDRSGRWCPINVASLMTFGGEVGNFTGGDRAFRLATSVEQHFEVLYFRFGFGIGSEAYKRSAIHSLTVGITYIEVAIGMEL